MEKLRFMRLWDLYGRLLTPTQQEITDMYFNLDLTVSEIAEQKGISRQGVSDCLSICKRELERFEEKLGHERLLEEGAARTARVVELSNRWAERFLENNPQYAADIAALKDIINADNAEEEWGGSKQKR